MKVITFISLCLYFNCLSAKPSDELEKEWRLFKARFSKKYDPIEDNLRMKIFADNKMKILRHNERFANGEVSFEMEMNQFGDMTHVELLKSTNGYRSRSKNNKAASFIPPYNAVLPDFVNWTAEGAVTEVKNQGFCGSCWAFSTTGSLEGQTFRKTGKLVSLSEQNLIDCSKKYDNDGCGGGDMPNAYAYINDNKGIDTEKSYPYEAKDDVCRYKPKYSGASVRGYVMLPSGDEDQLKIAVATVGPISIAIDASHMSFHYYRSGIYFEKKCRSEDRFLAHAVLIVGYGTENNKDYWLIKNSWDVTWGMGGYMKIARNRNNHCGVATAGSYPFV